MTESDGAPSWGVAQWRRSRRCQAVAAAAAAGTPRPAVWGHEVPTVEPRAAAAAGPTGSELQQ